MHQKILKEIYTILNAFFIDLDIGYLLDQVIFKTLNYMLNEGP